MSDLMFWLADNVVIWRPLAILALAGIVIGCVLFWMSAWEGGR